MTKEFRDRLRAYVRGNPFLVSLFQEAKLQHGKKDFCHRQYWSSSPAKSGMVGLKHLMLQQRIPEEFYLHIMWALMDALPPCNHDGPCRSWFPQVPGSLPRNGDGVVVDLLTSLRSGGKPAPMTLNELEVFIAKQD